MVLIDGTLVRTRRRTGKQNRRNYSGKHKAHGLLFLAVTDERRNLLWISAAKTRPRLGPDRRPPQQDLREVAHRRARRHRRPGLHRPGRRPRQPGDHDRETRRPEEAAHLGAEGGQQAKLYELILGSVSAWRFAYCMKIRGNGQVGILAY